MDVLTALEMFMCLCSCVCPPTDTDGCADCPGDIDH